MSVILIIHWESEAYDK